jgi:hypothetical protein
LLVRVARTQLLSLQRNFLVNPRFSNMVKSSPSKISKVEKSTSSISTGESSQEPDSSQGQEHGNSQECVDIAWEDDESVTIKKEPSDEYVTPIADAEYDAFVASTFIVLRLTDVEKRSFPGKTGNTETEDVCNVYTIDPLGKKRVFICWKEKAQQLHDYIT